MDDHDLGAMLDAAAPSAPASDEALERIRTRASQRRRRGAMAASALTVAIVTLAALGLSALGSKDRSGGVNPAGSSSTRGGTTTIVPDGRCFDGDVSLKIDLHPEVSKGYTPGTTRWAVVAVSRSSARCHLFYPIKATIYDSRGHVLTTVSGTRTANFLPADQGYAIELDPHTPTVVAHLSWSNPCSDGPVELEVAGYSPSTSRLGLGRQPCASGRTSAFKIDGPGPIAGTACPHGSITLAISLNGQDTPGTNRWSITGIAHTNYLCRVHAGLDATIETREGTVLSAIPGNPAAQGEVFQDLFRAGATEVVGYLRWVHPCSDAPVDLVVHYHGFDYGPAVRFALPMQLCLWGSVTNSHFEITGPLYKP